MKILNFILALALGCLGGIATSYAALPSITSQLNSANGSAQNQTSTPDQKSNYLGFGVQPQNPDNQKTDEILKDKPSWVKDELVQKYGAPLDGNWTGYESDQRAHLRYLGVSGAGMQAMDNYANLIRTNPNAWNRSTDGYCADASALSMYNLFGKDPNSYSRGQTVNPSDSFLDPFVLSGAYRYLQTGEQMLSGTIAVNASGTSDYHTAVFWQTAADALAGSPGEWVSQWPGNENWSVLGASFNSAVVPIGQPCLPVNNPNKIGSIGWASGLSQRWTSIRDTQFPEPIVHGTTLKN